MTCGIYVISDDGEGDVYVGQSTNIERRWYDHRYLLEGGWHSLELQEVWNSHRDSIRFVIVEECSVDQLQAREQFWMDRLNSTFNRSRVAGRPVTFVGYRQTDEHIQKRVQSRRQNGTYKHTDETREKLRQARARQTNVNFSGLERSNQKRSQERGVE